MYTSQNIIRVIKQGGWDGSSM